MNKIKPGNFKLVSHHVNTPLKIVKTRPLSNPIKSDRIQPKKLDEFQLFTKLKSNSSEISRYESNNQLRFLAHKLSKYYNKRILTRQLKDLKHKKNLSRYNKVVHELGAYHFFYKKFYQKR